MKYRWSFKELKESSDNFIIRAILSERMSELSSYSRLHRRLQRLYDKYNQLVADEEVEGEQKRVRNTP